MAACHTLHSFAVAKLCNLTILSFVRAFWQHENGWHKKINLKGVPFPIGSYYRNAQFARYCNIADTPAYCEQALEDVIAMLGRWDITTIRASVGRYLVCK